MKNSALTLVLALILAACSSGSSEAPQPTNVTSQFTGSYQSNNNLDRGTVTLDLIESGTDIAGNIIFIPDPAVLSTSCLLNTTIEDGTTNGFNISIQTNDITATISDGFTITTTTVTPAIPDNPDTDVDESVDEATQMTTVMSATGVPGTQVTTLADGTTITEVTAENAEIMLMGDINIQLAISNNGDTLSGTYVVTGDICSNQTGTGSLTVNRV